MIESYLSEVHPTNLLEYPRFPPLLLTEIVILPKAYKNFEEVFFL